MTPTHNSAETEPDMWVCMQCGRQFDRPTSSHPKHHPGCDGSRCHLQCPVECGPVEKMEANDE